MSLTCPDCQDRLIDYRLGELDTPARRDIAAHLAECGACAVAYCRLDADVSGIGAALYEAPPARVHAALKAQVAAEFRP
ncbi:MAG: anti-sigma factor, partial [Deltaproteobacteria bacterium]